MTDNKAVASVVLGRKPLPPHVRGSENRQPRRSPSALGPIARRMAYAYILIATVLGFGVVVTRPLYRYPALVLAIAMVVLARRHAVGRIRIPLPFLLLLAWTIASLAWTDSRASTFYELRANMSLVVATMVVASLAPLADLVSWQVRAFWWSLVLTIAVLILDPASRISGVVGRGTLQAWRGGFIHKNGLATFAAFAVPWVLAFEMRRPRKWLTLAVIVVLVVGSRSATGVVAVFLAAAVWGWLAIVQRRSSLPRTHLVAVTIPVVLFCALAIWSSLGTVAQLLGKELTLTGRTAIWREGLEAAAKQPLAGYGPGGLYSWPWSDETVRILHEAGFWHNHMHNGFLEVQLALGLVGVALVLALLLSCLKDGIRLWRREPTIARWLLTCVALIGTMAASERTLAAPGWLGAIVFIRIVALRIHDGETLGGGSEQPRRSGCPPEGAAQATVGQSGHASAPSQRP